MDYKTPLIFLIAFTITYSIPLHAGDVVALMSRDLKPFREAIEGFKSVVKQDVETIVYDNKRDPEGNDLYDELSDENIDFIFALGTKALNVSIKQFSHVPIIFCFVLTPEESVSQIDSLENVSIRGVSMTIPPEEQIREIKKISPNIKRIGVIFDNSKSATLIARAKKATTMLDMTLVEKEITQKEQRVNAIYELKDKVDAILMIADTTFISKKSVKHLLLFSFKNNVPIIGLSNKYVKKGALMALSFDYKDIGLQSGIELNNFNNKDSNNKNRSGFSTIGFPPASLPLLEPPESDST